MKHIVRLLVVSALIFGAPGFVGAQPDERLGSEHFGSDSGHAPRLTPEQRKAVDAFRDKRLKVQKLQLQMKIARLDLLELMRAEKIDKNAIQAQLEKVNQAQAEVNKARVENFLTLRETFSRAELRMFMERMLQFKGRGKFGKKGQFGGVDGEAEGQGEFF